MPRLMFSSQKIQLGLPQGLILRQPTFEAPVEAFHQLRGGDVVNVLQTDDHAFGSGVMEGPR